MASPGERVGPYTLVRPLRAETGGELWSARDREAREVAIRLSPLGGRDQEEAERLLFEKVEAAKLARHENLVAVLDGGCTRGERYIVTERVDGLALSQALELGPGGPWPSFGLGAYITMEVARALAELHGAMTPGGARAPLVHRDVSPRTVFVDLTGRIKLAEPDDLLTSHALLETAGQSLHGRVAYLSPEAVSTREVGAESDVFALGAVFWELLARRPLFLRTTDLETLDAIRSGEIPSVPSDCPPELAAIARCCLAKRPEDRPSAGVLAKDLARAIAGLEGADREGAQVFVRAAAALIDVRASRRPASSPRRTLPLPQDDHEHPTPERGPGRSEADTLLPSAPALPSSGEADTHIPPPPGPPGARARAGAGLTTGERALQVDSADVIARGAVTPRVSAGSSGASSPGAPGGAAPPPPPPRSVVSVAQDPFFDESRDGGLWQGGRFEVLEQIGSGGMGEVFRVRDRELDEIVAIKLIPRESATELRSTERLKREVRLARKISSPFVCRMHDIVDLGNGARGLMMGIIEGTTLAELMRARLQVDYRRFARWGADLADGLAAAHELSIIHRDLKPENVMIQPDDRPVILDFGIAYSSEPEGKNNLKLTQAGMIMGTPLYMSPEQLMNLPLDGRSDLFALGLILAELITGEVPLRGGTYAELVERRVTRVERYHLAEIDPGAPPELAAVVDALLAPAIPDRPRDAATARELLRAVGGDRPSNRPKANATAPEPGVRTRPEPLDPAPARDRRPEPQAAGAAAERGDRPPANDTAPSGTEATGDERAKERSTRTAVMVGAAIVAGMVAASAVVLSSRGSGDAGSRDPARPSDAGRADATHAIEGAAVPATNGAAPDAGPPDAGAPLDAGGRRDGGRVKDIPDPVPM